LAAQGADVDVHEVGRMLPSRPPHVLEDLRPRQDLAGMLHQILEQAELPVGERDAPARQRRPAAGRVEGEVADTQRPAPFPGGNPEQYPQPLEQLTEGERLDEVVVRSCTEGPDPVLDPIPGADDEDGYLAPSLPERR